MLHNSPSLLPTFVSLSSAVPKQAFDQNTLWDSVFDDWYADIPDARDIGTVTRVRKRHMAWDPARELGGRTRGIGERMKDFVGIVDEVAGEAVENLLQTMHPTDVGSIVMASSTGYYGPTPDYFLAKRFGFKSNIRRTFIGHMGCFAAFNVIKTAIDSVTTRPNEYTVGVCAEFSSLHFRPDPSREQAIVHNLFGDAVGAFTLAMREPGHGPQILATHTHQSYDTSDMMTLSVLDDGVRMTLSPYVPFVIASLINQFIDDLCASASVDPANIKHWAIHPGGPKIVDMVAQRLNISEHQLASTWHVLSEYGNCASATVLLVLEHLIANDKPQPGELGVMLAFGPGLTLEGALLRF
ncbi:type III polyketide synthase [Microvirga terricola]|uniref:Type III polyketide synthase n=1 Tax=Microvirga terricola TaxID=2719797 RepID=A0ABX0VCM4_9HYPH|nr:type III polyketide synthase [Microvirga terricola]NIX77588.1 type III polyketide synthase [Microvirga terricola]